MNYYAMAKVDDVLNVISNSKRIKEMNVAELPRKWETLYQAYTTPSGCKQSAYMDCKDIVNVLAEFSTVINSGIVSHNLACFSFGIFFKYKDFCYFWKHTKDNDYIYKVTC